MKNTFTQIFLENYTKIRDFVSNLFINLAIIIGIFYSWFWIIREVFILESTNIEHYVLWFVGSCLLDYIKEIKFKKK